MLGKKKYAPPRTVTKPPRLVGLRRTGCRGTVIDPVASVAELRDAAAAIAPHGPVVLQVERNGQIMFLAFELD